MPDYTHCYFLLPSHGLDDLPLDYRGEAAENLLDCWTVCWHPAILAATNRPPQMLRSGIDEVQHPNAVVVSPQAAIPLLSERFYDSVSRYQAHWVGRETSNQAGKPPQPAGRKRLVHDIVLNWPLAQQLLSHVTPSSAADFYALGFCYLQTQLMTRQLRYSSNLEQTKFDQHLLAAARAATESSHSPNSPDSPNSLDDNLQTCFDLLLEEKNRYYPVEPKVVDIVLLAPTTLRQSLSDQLQSTHRLTDRLTHRLTFAASADVFQTLSQVNPQAFQELQQRLNQKEFCVIGGLSQELPDPLLSTETTLRQLARGIDQYLHLFGQRPQTFFRRTSGLHPLLPGALDLFDFPHALHVLSDAGQLPSTSAHEIRWEGLDGVSLLSFAGKLLNAAEAGDLLNVGTNIGRQIESWHTASLIFAHWPNQACTAFHDLLNSQKFGRLLGTTITLDEYFETAYDPGYNEPLELADYRWPFLDQATLPNSLNPISRFVDYWQRHYQLLNLCGLVTQLAIQRHYSPSTGVSDELASLSTRLHDLQFELDSLLNPETGGAESPRETEFKQRLLEIFSEVQMAAAQTYQKVLSNPQALLEIGILQTSPHSSEDSVSNLDRIPNRPSPTPATTGFAVHNALSFRRRLTADVPAPSASHLEQSLSPFLFSESSSSQSEPHTNRSHAVLELPGTGTVIWTTPNRSIDQHKRSRPSKPAIDLVDDLKIRNEFFELNIDPQRGGILSIRDYRKRESLVSQQLAARVPLAFTSSGHPASGYTTMVAETIETTVNNSLEGAIRSTGRLTWKDETIAQFIQTVRLQRGRPLAEIEIELTLPTNDYRRHRNFYVANRIAWRDEAAYPTCNFQECHVAANNEWLLATHFIQIPQSPQSITLLTGGLPYHRRVARRMLDSLLICGGETKTQFRIAIGLDISHPLLAAISWMARPIVIPLTTPLTTPHAAALPATATATASDLDCNSGSVSANKLFTSELLHFDRRNILVTSWEPIWGETANLTGIKLGCRETEGRAGDLTIATPWSVTSATRVNAGGKIVAKLPVSGNQPSQIKTAVSAYELFYIILNL